MAKHEFYGEIKHDPATGVDHSATLGQVQAAQAAALSRANHTGTQPVSTLSDFTTEVNNLIAARLAAIVDADNTDAINSLTDLIEYAKDNAGDIAGLLTRIVALEAAPPPGPTAYALSGTASSFTVSHGKGRWVQVQVILASTGQIVHPVVTGVTATATSCTVDFSASVDGSLFTVLVS